MEASTHKKWVPMTVVLLSVVGSFAALMYLSITTFSNVQGRTQSPFFRFQQSPAQWRGSTPTAQFTVPGWKRMVLVRDRQKRVGGAVLTYRGFGERSTIRIDAVITDLDPQYTYRQRFDIDRARNGFKVGGERLKLLFAGRYKMRFKHYTPAR